MDAAVVQMIIQASIEIFMRHYKASGEQLSAEQVAAQLRDQIASGQHEIADWFAKKGLPLPL